MLLSYLYSLLTHVFTNWPENESNGATYILTGRKGHLRVSLARTLGESASSAGSDNPWYESCRYAGMHSRTLTVKFTWSSVWLDEAAAEQKLNFPATSPPPPSTHPHWQNFCATRSGHCGKESDTGFYPKVSIRGPVEASHRAGPSELQLDFDFWINLNLISNFEPKLNN